MPGLEPGIPVFVLVDGRVTPGTARKGRPSGGGHDGIFSRVTLYPSNLAPGGVGTSKVLSVTETNE
jgi:hypothetical protein